MKRRTRTTPENDDIMITYENTVPKKLKKDLPEESSSLKTKPVSKSSKSLNKSKTLWTIPEVLSQSFQVDISHCEQFTSLLEDDCTLPFIARYRKEAVGDVQIEELRKMKSSVDQLK